MPQSGSERRGVCSSRGPMIPCLLVAFNRPEHTERAIAGLRTWKPPRVYFAVDGARPGREGEFERVERVRALASRFDWGCEVKTRFAPVNRGCRYGVSEAIDWFFSCEPEGAVIEDDIVTSPDFARFCAAGLERFRSDPRVGVVAGLNPSPVRGDGSPEFSGYGMIWGWASWRRAWRHFNVDPALGGPEFEAVTRRSNHASPGLREFWRHVFLSVVRHEVDTWDFQLTFSLLTQGMLCVLPPVNLVDNIGFGAAATHTFEAKPRWLVAPEPLPPGAFDFGEPVRNPRIDRRVGRTLLGLTFRHELSAVLRAGLRIGGV